jgi:hypothetical protein
MQASARDNTLSEFVKASLRWGPHLEEIRSFLFVGIQTSLLRLSLHKVTTPSPMLVMPL